MLRRKREADTLHLADEKHMQYAEPKLLERVGKGAGASERKRTRRTLVSSSRRAVKSVLQAAHASTIACTVREEEKEYVSTLYGLNGAKNTREGCTGLAQVSTRARGECAACASLRRSAHKGQDGKGRIQRARVGAA